MRTLWLVALLAACTPATPPPTAPSSTPSTTASSRPPSNQVERAPAAASPRLFDGFSLGDPFARVLARAPYDQRCDDDPIDGQYRVMVYAARPCRGRTFPDGTSVVFILDRDHTIRAFGWLGGSYYQGKVALPLEISDSVARATAVYGKPFASFDLRSLHVDRFAGSVAVLSEGQTIVGFVFGAMPDDPAVERWSVFDQMYRRYTPRPAPSTAAVSAADCMTLMEHIAHVRGTDPKDAQQALDRGDRDDWISSCRWKMTPQSAACIHAASTPGELDRCEPGR